MQQKVFSIFIYVFAILFIITVPFPHKFIPDIATYIHPFFEALVKCTGKYIFHIDHYYTTKLISDSTGLYIHVFNLLCISLFTALFLVMINRTRKNLDRIFYWTSVLISYYLALQLFEYGFSKLFKWQFYLPEPNTLFTTMGNTYPDLMYWSTMGVSRSYTIFAGIVEIIPACLLLFKRTRLAGGVLAFFVLTNVVAINFSYDISVKILSCFLLLLSAVIIAPSFKKLLSFFLVSNISIERKNTTEDLTIRSKRVYIPIKVGVIGYILFSTLSPYFIENNFNDDGAQRPLFHGAYDVTVFVRNNDTLPPMLNTLRWKRAFVHRKNYFIVQNMYDDMQDYTLVTDTIQHLFILNKEDEKKTLELHYQQLPDSSISLHGIINTDTIAVQLQPNDFKKLPALQKEFNWTIDGF